MALVVSAIALVTAGVTIKQCIEVKQYIENTTNDNDINNISVSEGTVQIGDNNTNIDGDNVDIDIIDTILPSVDSDADLEEIMKYAEQYYSVEKYDVAFRIYYSLKNSYPNNAEIMTDLAYLYSEGLGCEQNVEKAIELYDLAIEEKYERATFLILKM